MSKQRQGLSRPPGYHYFWILIAITVFVAFVAAGMGVVGGAEPGQSGEHTAICADTHDRTDKTTFYVGSHQHGRPDNSDRFKEGSFPSSRHTMEPFDYGVIRSHNVEALNAGSHNRWWIGRSNGVNIYDWSILDGWVDKVTSRGHRILLNLFGVPEFAARLHDYRDVYGVVGGTSGPSDLSAWREFVRDTVLRVTERKGLGALVAVEAWNEAIGDDSNGTGKFLVSRGYAPGRNDSQAILLADITKYTFLGLRDVSTSRGIPLLCGAQAYFDSGSLDRLFAARTLSGEHIMEYCDAMSFHPYGISDSKSVQFGLTETTKQIRHRLQKIGCGDLPLWASEVGLNAPWNSETAKWWAGKSVLQRAEALYEWVYSYKHLGWRAVITYSSDNSDDFIGSPQTNAEISRSLSRAYHQLESN